MPTPTSRTTAKKAPARKAAAAKKAVSSAVEQLMAEAAGGPEPIATWDWAGETWQILKFPDIRAIAMAQRGDFAGALKKVLGPEETGRLLAHDTDEEFGVAELWSLMNTVAEPTGATAGE